MGQEKEQIKPEFYCMLNVNCDCIDRGYMRDCSLITKHKFANISCEYRREALVYIPKLKMVCSPEEYKNNSGGLSIYDRNTETTKGDSEISDTVQIEAPDVQTIPIEDVF